MHVKDPSGNFVHIFVGHDMSPQQEKVEVLTGALVRAVSEVSGKKAFAKRADGVVLLDFIPVAAI